MAKGDCIFAATGVTDGSLLQGVHRRKSCVTTESIVMRASSGTVRRVLAEHYKLEARTPSRLASFLGSTVGAWGTSRSTSKNRCPGSRGAGAERPSRPRAWTPWSTSCCWPAASRATTSPVTATRSIRDFLPDPPASRTWTKAPSGSPTRSRRGETIAIFGDYDVDGATSAALLTLLLRRLGAEPIVYIPDRLMEGYGPSGEALVELKSRGASVAVCVDCGAQAFDALEEAKTPAST